MQHCRKIESSTYQCMVLCLVCACTYSNICVNEGAPGQGLTHMHARNNTHDKRFLGTVHMQIHRHTHPSQLLVLLLQLRLQLSQPLFHVAMALLGLQEATPTYKCSSYKSVNVQCTFDLWWHFLFHLCVCVLPWIVQPPSVPTQLPPLAASQPSSWSVPTAALPSPASLAVAAPSPRSDGYMNTHTRANTQRFWIS